MVDDDRDNGMIPRGRFPAGATRLKDGARMQCPDHPDADLYQGYTRSGQMRTWCTVEGCTHAAQWVKSRPADNGKRGR